jgi:mycofactocin precursor
MSGHHPMRMSPGASGLRLRVCVMLPGLRRDRRGHGDQRRDAPGDEAAVPRRSYGPIDGGSPGPWRSWHGRRGACGVPAAGQAREATVTQQAITVLVPEQLAASERPAEPGASGNEALVTGERLVEEISIDRMCGVY